MLAVIESEAVRTNIHGENRYLYVRVLSLRPLLLLTTKLPSKFAVLTSTEHPETLDMDLVKRSCNVCVTSALRLIDNIQRNLGTSYTCSAWHSVYCKRPPIFPMISVRLG